MLHHTLPRPAMVTLIPCDLAPASEPKEDEEEPIAFNTWCLHIPTKINIWLILSQVQWRCWCCGHSRQFWMWTGRMGYWRMRSACGPFHAEFEACVMW